MKNYRYVYNVSVVVDDMYNFHQYYDASGRYKYY
jgi:hypothetical protein